MNCKTRVEGQVKVGLGVYEPGVYERLPEAGKAYGLANAGYRAIERLRLEKGYLARGSDIGPDHPPLEAGPGWAVNLASFVSRCHTSSGRPGERSVAALGSST